MKKTTIFTLIALTLASNANAQNVIVQPHGEGRKLAPAGPTNNGYDLMILAPDIGDGAFSVIDDETQMEVGNAIRGYDPNEDKILYQVNPPAGYAFRATRSVNRQCDTMAVPMRKLATTGGAEDSVAIINTRNFSLVKTIAAPAGYTLADVHVDENCAHVHALGRNAGNKVALIMLQSGYSTVLYQSPETAYADYGRLVADTAGNSYLHFHVADPITGMPIRILRGIDNSGGLFADQSEPVPYHFNTLSHDFRLGVFSPIYGNYITAISTNYPTVLLNADRYDMSNLKLDSLGQIPHFTSDYYFMPGMHGDPGVDARLFWAENDLITEAQLEPNTAVVGTHVDLFAPLTQPHANGGAVHNINMSTLAAPATASHYMFIAGSFSDGGSFIPQGNSQDWKFWSILDRNAEFFMLFQYRDDVPQWAEFVEDKRDWHTEPNVPDIQNGENDEDVPSPPN